MGRELQMSKNRNREVEEQVTQDECILTVPLQVYL
jgi:hypothetical protein